jgi:putative tricarboxylic transport membrane protein
MRRFGYPRPAMILGLVLGDLMEKYLYRSVASYGFSWLSRPAVIVLLILAGESLLLLHCAAGSRAGWRLRPL